MKEFIAVATIHYYNTIDNTTECENIVLTEVENFVDAMSRIETYYGNELESAEITLLEGPFIKMNDHYLKLLNTGKMEEKEE